MNKLILLALLLSGLVAAQQPRGSSFDSQNARRIQRRNVSATAPTYRQLLQWRGTILPVVFTGAGLNDATSGGTYTGNVNAAFEAVIQDAAASPDQFKWRKDGGAWTEKVAIIAGVAQVLSDGVTVTFLAGDGHTLADQWTVYVTTLWEPNIVAAGGIVGGGDALTTAGRGVFVSAAGVVTESAALTTATIVRGAASLTGSKALLLDAAAGTAGPSALSDDGTTITATGRHVAVGTALPTAGAPPSSLALAGTLYSAVPNQGFIVFGDSLTLLNADNLMDGDNAGSGQQDRGYMNWANVLLRQAFPIIKNAGVGGNRTADLLARIQTDVLAYRPKYCLVFIGGNDLVNAVSSDVVIKNLEDIYYRIRTAGIKLIISPVYPSTSLDTEPEKTAWATVNAWINAYATANPSVVLADISAPLQDGVDPTQPATGMTVDGVHPSPQGAYAMATALAPVLKTILDIPPPLFIDPTVSNLLANGTFTGGGGTAAGNTTGTVAANWTVNSSTPSGVASLVAKQGGGFWQQVVRSGGTAASENSIYAANVAVNATLAVGDTVRGYIEFQTEDDWADVGRLEFKLQGLGVAYDAYGPKHASADPDLTIRPTGGIFRTVKFIVPVGCTAVRMLVIHYGGAGTLRVGSAVLRKE